MGWCTYLFRDALLECESFSSNSASDSSSELAKYAWWVLLDPLDFEISEDGRETEECEGVAFHWEGDDLERSKSDNGRLLLSMAIAPLLLLLELMSEQCDGTAFAKVDISADTKCSDPKPEELPKFLQDGLVDETVGNMVAFMSCNMGIQKVSNLVF